MMDEKSGLSQSEFATASALPHYDSSMTSLHNNGFNQNSNDRVSFNSASETSSQTSSDMSITMALDLKSKSNPKKSDGVKLDLRQPRRVLKTNKNYAASSNSQTSKRPVTFLELPKLRGLPLSTANSIHKIAQTAETNASVPHEIGDSRQPKSSAWGSIEFVKSDIREVKNADTSRVVSICQQVITSLSLSSSNLTLKSDTVSQKKYEYSELGPMKNENIRAPKIQKIDQNDLSHQINLNEYSRELFLTQKATNSHSNQTSSTSEHNVKFPENFGTKPQTELSKMVKPRFSTQKSSTDDTGPGCVSDFSLTSRDHVSLACEINISEDFEDTALPNDRTKEKVRALQGTDPLLEHIDFDGTRIPPPCDWEGGRPRFDNSFMNSYIHEWMEDIPNRSLPDAGFRETQKWLSGNFHVDGFNLIRPFDHIKLQPTPGETCKLEARRIHQTANGVIQNEYKKFQQKLARQKRLEMKHLNPPCEIVRFKTEDNSFSPKIPMYLRPVEYKDSEQIAQIYNKHVAGGNITEDQEPISNEDVLHLIKNNQREKLPFIVAVAGYTPRNLDEYDSQTQPEHASISKIEKIIGFAFNERYNYGFSGSVKGRSRYTTTLQLFVAHDHQRKGIGRNLLDRLIHMLSTAYGYKKACDFINPRSDKVHECEGSGMWHQIQFHVPVLKKDDPDFPGINNFLYSRFLVKELYRMKSTGRTSVSRGPAKWLDTAIFQFETSQEGNFDPFC